MLRPAAPPQASRLRDATGGCLGPGFALAPAKSASTLKPAFGLVVPADRPNVRSDRQLLLQAGLLPPRLCALAMENSAKMSRNSALRGKTARYVN